MNGVNLAEKLSTFSEHWQPRTVGEFNGHDLMVAKVKGEFVWHRHDDTDDFFLVVKGRFRMDFREDGNERGEWIEPGEFIIVPHGVEHRPFAEEECEVVLLEPASTLNTGNVEDEFTRKELETV